MRVRQRIIKKRHHDLHIERLEHFGKHGRHYSVHNENRFLEEFQRDHLQYALLDRRYYGKRVAVRRDERVRIAERLCELVALIVHADGLRAHTEQTDYVALDYVVEIILAVVLIGYGGSPFASRFARYRLILYEDVRREPARARADKMLERLLGIALGGNFLFKCGDDYVAHIVVYLFMYLVAAVIYRALIGFFLREMLYGVAFKILDRFHTGHFVSFKVHIHEVIDDAVDYRKKLFMRPVYLGDADLVFFFPFKKILLQNDHTLTFIIKFIITQLGKKVKSLFADGLLKYVLIACRFGWLLLGFLWLVGEDYVGERDIVVNMTLGNYLEEYVDDMRV